MPLGHRIGSMRRKQILNLRVKLLELSGSVRQRPPSGTEINSM